MFPGMNFLLTLFIVISQQYVYKFSKAWDLD